PVAAGDDPGGAVGLLEVVERPHRGQHDLVVWTRQRVDAVVVVEDLGDFTRADLDTGGGAELIVAEHVVGDTEYERVDGRLVEEARLGEQRVDPSSAE